MMGSKAPAPLPDGAEAAVRSLLALVADPGGVKARLDELAVAQAELVAATEKHEAAKTGALAEIERAGTVTRAAEAARGAVDTAEEALDRKRRELADEMSAEQERLWAIEARLKRDADLLERERQAFEIERSSARSNIMAAEAQIAARAEALRVSAAEIIKAAAEAKALRDEYDEKLAKLREIAS